MHFPFTFVFDLICRLRPVSNRRPAIIPVKRVFLSLSFKVQCISGSLLRELATHFSSFAIHNRKNLFRYSCEGVDYYFRFREDIHLPSKPGMVDDSLLLSENYPTIAEPPSPQIAPQSSSTVNNSMKNRQRHDSVRFIAISFDGKRGES